MKWLTYYAYTVHVSDNPDVTEKDYRTYLKVESPSSNSWLYHYTVPERDAQNNPIEYTSEQFFPEAYADKYKLVTNYEDDPNHYLAIGLTEFTFTMKWADAYDSTARPEVDLKYITDNFTLYMMKDGQEKQVNFLPDDLPDPQQHPEAYAAALEKYFSLSVDEETGITTVTIKHLEDINEEGTANEYYLKQNNANHTLPVNQSAALVDKANDYYDVKTENSGLHASDYYTTYEGGQIELVLTGTTDFSATVEWKDNETAEIRKRDDTAAELSLWRYVGNESAEAAIVKTENVNGAENSTTVNFNGNSKYDLLGNLYTYYAVEKITVEETNPEQPAEAEKLPYAAEYPDNDRMLKNGQTVTNRLSDMVEYSVSADWTAAARQGGVATATYQLQRKTKNASEWEPVMVGGTETPMELNVNFSEHYMSRHGDDSCIFPEVEVYDEDENGNPLRGAVFKLYKDGAPDTVLATFNTGYDGMNPTAFELDCSQYAWNQKFYLLEETPPTGYSADNDGTPERNRIEFTLTPELAEEALHIIRANDARLKGKVTLTKVASARTTVNNAGDPLGGAVFELYTKSGTQLSLYPHTTDTNRWRVAYEDDDAAIITEAGFDSDNAHKVTEMTTAADGKLHIEGIDWGEFYLKEKTAPIGFKLPDSEDAKKVFFSVGQNNSGDTPQELKMKNDPLTATLNIAKQVDSLNIDAWGTPTFIFKLRQTERYDAEHDSFVALETDKQRTLTKTVSPVTADLWACEPLP